MALVPSSVLVTTSKALVATSDAPVTSKEKNHNHIIITQLGVDSPSLALMPRNVCVKVVEHNIYIYIYTC